MADEVIEAEYVSGGRFFASIVLHEGSEMIKTVSGFLGRHVLMFSTDYPHPETRFPDSVDLVLGWKQLDAVQDDRTSHCIVKRLAEGTLPPLKHHQSMSSGPLTGGLAVCSINPRVPS